MKKITLITLIAFCCSFFYSCKPEAIETICACGVNDPAKNLTWLAEVIKTAEVDETGSYFGVIWLEQYNGQDVFVTNMMLGSEGVPYHVFDCEGNPMTIENGLDFFNNLKKDIVIYTHPNYPFDEDEIIACGVINPAKNLPWLAEFIETAEVDETGSYFGVIWLEQYNGQDVFVTNMMLGIGGVPYHVFDCEGNPVTIENGLDFFNNLKKDIVIYTHPNYPIDESEIIACGVINPAKNLTWLAKLIERAEVDETGNYYGVIWLEQYNGQDVFVTNMMLGSGGLAYHVFNCEGYAAIIEDASYFFNNLKKDIVIYVHPDYPPLHGIRL